MLKYIDYTDKKFVSFQTVLETKTKSLGLS